jgi:hypothetical protein
MSRPMHDGDQVGCNDHPIGSRRKLPSFCYRPGRRFIISILSPVPIEIIILTNWMHQSNQSAQMMTSTLLTTSVGGMDVYFVDIEAVVLAHNPIHPQIVQ